MPEPYESIEHVVVLMQENRSFDNMLGWQFGLSESLFNRADDGKPIRVWRDEGTDPQTMSIPTPDPGELPFIQDKLSTFLLRDVRERRR